MSTPGVHKPPSNARYQSLREALRTLLHSSRTAAGAPIPRTASELTPLVEAEGFVVGPRDVEAMLRDLAESGEVIAIDENAGYRCVA